MGLLSVVTKGFRFIYILLGLERMAIGVIMYNLPLVGEVSFIVMLVFTVISRVIGLLVMVNLITSYGSEKVAF